MNPFRLWWRSTRDTFDELLPLTLMGIVWLIGVAPLPVLAGGFVFGEAYFGAVALMLLTSLPLGALSVGLTAVAQRIYEGRTVKWADFVAGIRRYYRVGWVVYGAWMLGLVVICINIWFYAQMQPPVGGYLTVLFIYILFVWVGLLVYLGPVTMLQEQPSVRLAFRNAFVLSFGRPFFTLATQALMTVIVFLSLWPPLLLLLLITPALLAVWGYRATVTLIAAAEARREALKGQERAADDPANPAATGKGRGGQIRPRE